MTTAGPFLPIDAVLPDIMAALLLKPNAVVVAPPGAGKTTRVAPALLREPWCKGAVWLLSPRRLAARAAAERIGEEMGEAVGLIPRERCGHRREVALQRQSLPFEKPCHSAASASTLSRGRISETNRFAVSHSQSSCCSSSAKVDRGLNTPISA